MPCFVGSWQCCSVIERKIVAEKIKNVYEFDYERTKDRVNLIMGSFDGAPDVDKEYLEKAMAQFHAAFGNLKRALNL